MWNILCNFFLALYRYRAFRIGIFYFASTCMCTVLFWEAATKYVCSVVVVGAAVSYCGSWLLLLQPWRWRWIDVIYRSLTVPLYKWRAVKSLTQCALLRSTPVAYSCKINSKSNTTASLLLDSVPSCMSIFVYVKTCEAKGESRRSFFADIYRSAAGAGIGRDDDVEWCWKTLSLSSVFRRRFVVVATQWMLSSPFVNSLRSSGHRTTGRPVGHTSTTGKHRRHSPTTGRPGRHGQLVCSLTCWES